MEYAILFLPLAASLLSYFGKNLDNLFSEIITSFLISISAILSIFIFYDGIINNTYGNYKIFEWVNSGDFVVDGSLLVSGNIFYNGGIIMGQGLLNNSQLTLGDLTQDGNIDIQDVVALVFNILNLSLRKPRALKRELKKPEIRSRRALNSNWFKNIEIRIQEGQVLVITNVSWVWNRPNIL